MNALVVLPSFNERENIISLIEDILTLSTELDVCVVDDSSPDGTAALVASEIASRGTWGSRVTLIVREGKDGRGSAIRSGFAEGLANQPYENFVEMDCDYSHDPADIPVGLALLRRGWDVVIGARYPEGEIIGWPMRRRVFSRAANLLIRSLIDWSVLDYTNGYRFYTQRAVRTLLGEPQRHKGFIYLSETLAVLLRSGHRVASFPIVFKNRERGSSNTNFSEIAAALRGILVIAWRFRTSRRP